MLPEIVGLKHKVKTKFEIEKYYVNVKNNTFLINLKENVQLMVICCLIYNNFFLVGITFCYMVEEVCVMLLVAML